MGRRFLNRQEAGRRLARCLESDYSHHPQGLVLALPRGGVPVAKEIAVRLNLPLDLCLVRKLGVPQHPELAMGAIATGEIVILNSKIIQDLNIPDRAIAAAIAKEKQELERRSQVYRGQRRAPVLENRLLILVDDGIATGATLKAAIATVQAQNPCRLIVAAPIGAKETCQAIAPLVDDLVCLEVSSELTSISCWYEDFSQVSDAEVCQLLRDTVG